MDTTRMKELAGLNEAVDASMPYVLVVTDPRGEKDELGDIFYEAEPAELMLIGAGIVSTKEDPKTMNIKFYHPKDRTAALRDAESRLSPRRFQRQSHIRNI